MPPCVLSPAFLQRRGQAASWLGSGQGSRLGTQPAKGQSGGQQPLQPPRFVPLPKGAAGTRAVEEQHRSTLARAFLETDER